MENKIRPAVIDEASILPKTVLGQGISKKDISQVLNQILPEIEVFENRDFKGESWRTSLSYRFIGSE